MNKPLRRVALAMMAMVVLLMANATYVQVIEAQSLRENALNKRTQYEEYSHQRGQIIAGGQSIANSVRTNERDLKYLRRYPDGPAFAPVTGFYSFWYGSDDIEREENQILNGTDDSMAFSRLSDTISGKEPKGGNVELTLNPAMQKAAYEGLTKRGYTGSVVALDPKTGGILAMANAPSYDPNLLATHDNNAVSDNWKKLENAPGSPMSNRAISEVYPPGSSFKLITAAAALDKGYTEQSYVTDAQSITLPGTNTPLPNYAGETCSGNTLKDALAHSCNTAFAEVAGDVGTQKLRDEAAQFGFGQDLDIPMSVADSQLGDIPDEAALYQSGIGQRDVRMTPLQNAMVVSAIANGGKLMKPQLVKNAMASDMSPLRQFEPEQMSQPMSPDQAGAMTDMMLKSEEYSQPSAGGGVPGVDIASKTGTAQHGDPLDRPHGWYVAFAPAEDPKIAIAVIVENGGDLGADAVGAKIAGPVARDVISAGLQGGG